MRNFLILFAAFSFVFALAAPASAQNFEIGAKIGIWGADSVDEAAPAGETNDSSFLVYGAVAQYNLDKNWSVRLDIELDSTDYVDCTTFVISAVYNYYISDDAAWVPYVRGGIVIGSIDLDFTGAPDFDSDFGFEFGLGASYLFEGWRFFGEAGYRFITFDGDTLTPDVDLDGFFVSLGFTYAF